MLSYMTSFVLQFAAACTPGQGGTFLGFPTWYKYLDGETKAGKCSPIIDFAEHPQQIAAILLAVVEILLRVGGLVAIAFVIMGGFRYLTSQGEPENTASARKTIINALVGLIITIFATVIVRFIGERLG
jgi:hypothetical protein